MNEQAKQTRQKIMKWLQDEKWRYNIEKDDDSIFNLVVHPNESDNVKVIITDVQAQKIAIITRISFREMDITAYVRLSESAKREFLMSLEILLIQINIIYRVFPNPPHEIHGMELQRNIYFDGLTTDKFFDSIVALLRGLRIFRMSYHSLYESEPSDTAME
jgi:hypothetical protein